MDDLCVHQERCSWRSRKLFPYVRVGPALGRIPFAKWFFFFVTISLKAQQLAQLVSNLVHTFPLFWTRLSKKMKPRHWEELLLSHLLSVNLEKRMLQVSHYIWVPWEKINGSFVTHNSNWFSFLVDSKHDMAKDSEVFSMMRNVSISTSQVWLSAELKTHLGPPAFTSFYSMVSQSVSLISLSLLLCWGCIINRM